MLGSDLRRLVSEKFPRKSGAKIALQHLNDKLKLDESLGEQGIVGKSAMLSCTYVPINVYTAWLCLSASDLPDCEREFALEGVTSIEGASQENHLQCKWFS